MVEVSAFQLFEKVTSADYSSARERKPTLESIEE